MVFSFLCFVPGIVRTFQDPWSSRRRTKDRRGRIVQSRVTGPGKVYRIKTDVRKSVRYTPIEMEVLNPLLKLIVPIFNTCMFLHLNLVANLSKAQSENTYSSDSDNNRRLSKNSVLYFYCLDIQYL